MLCLLSLLHDRGLARCASLGVPQATREARLRLRSPTLKRRAQGIKPVVNRTPGGVSLLAGAPTAFKGAAGCRLPRLSSRPAAEGLPAGRQAVSRKGIPLLSVAPSSGSGQNFESAIKQVDEPQFRDTVCRIGCGLLALIIRQTGVGDFDQEQELSWLGMGSAIVVRVGNADREVRFRLAPVIEYDRKLAADGVGQRYASAQPPPLYDLTAEDIA